MSKQSAGILLYRTTGHGVEVLLVHPGGPFWAKKDAGAWSIPKGEFSEDEDPSAAAAREFHEELGMAVPEGERIPLGSAKQASGKIVHAWALCGDVAVEQIKSNTFHMQWPPKTGKEQEFPEVDRAAWFSLAGASKKVVKGQVPLLETLAKKLGANIEPTTEQSAQASLF
ncbi:MAG TPA: NUDIX domain-containing protein [Candidatus Saccharimonadales bacterium]|nr:NUDIX domain-containing protein [Candidatus Saccharimonadales bacterium]